jgi:outer membrane protein
MTHALNGCGRRGRGAAPGRGALALALAAAPLALGLAVPAMARADTLAEALAAAYRNNPTLQSQRAQLAALNEEYVQARAGLRPQVTLQASAAAENVQQISIFGGRQTVRDDPDSISLNLVQPLYTGGRLTSTIRAAEADILAGREELRSSEATILLTVVEDYENVRLDQQIVDIRAAELVTLQGQLDDAAARLKAGEVTRTDVLQSKAQLQSAQAQQQLAIGQLEVAKSAYAAVVGGPPGKLEEPPVLPGLPSNLDEAFDAAEADNADLQRARFSERASRARIAEARAAGAPNVSLQGSYGYNGLVSPFDPGQHLHDFRIGLALSQPITTGGVNSSNVRRSVELNSSDRSSVELARRTALQAAAQSWNGYVSLRQSAATDRADVITSSGYFADTTTEYRIGQRSTLDVLIAEQTFRAAELAVVQADHDAYIGAAELLQAMGRLNASALFETLPPDEVRKAFARVRNANALPWDNVIAALDNIGGARAGPGLDTPQTSLGKAGPPQLKTGPAIPADAPLETAPNSRIAQ